MNKIKLVFVFTSCKKCGPIQQMLNLIKNLDFKKFSPILITLYQEAKDGSSQLEKYLPYVKHLYVPLNKRKILLGQLKNLNEVINKLEPDIIHSLGVFPDIAINKIKPSYQVTTIRNFVFDDYPSKFGKIIGYIFANLHMKVLKKTKQTYTCSRSLENEYKEKLGVEFPFICNGVDIEAFKPVTKMQKNEIRSKLGIELDKKIIVYSGQFVSRKNQIFLAECFKKNKYKNCQLYFLGDGKELKDLKEKFESPNIKFLGNVSNVGEFLQAADIYVSSSKSEGLPNGVLEAMATGLPVLLSDIEQHKELFIENDSFGYLYKAQSEEDFNLKLLTLLKSDLEKLSINALKVGRNVFSAKIMSENYQNKYIELIEKRKRES